MIITSEMIISGFASKIINDFVDILEIPIKNALKNADKNRKAKNQSIETRIYQVTIDSIKEFTKRDYKDQDVLYDAAESILKGFIRNKDDKVEAVRAGLKMLVSQVTSDTCEDFFGVLCYEICKEENRDLTIEVIILQQEQAKENVQKGFRRCDLNYEEINGKLDYLIKELVNKRVNEERNDSKNPIVNRAEEYAQKWDENVFLNNFNEEDEYIGTEIKLWEIYKEDSLPHYIWKRNTRTSDRLKNLLNKYLMNSNDKKMLLILGQPGIGKSTLITWVVANMAEKRDDILVCQFANDLGSIDWQSEKVLDDILKAIGLEYDDLEDKTLILDGFDEIYVGINRERILNRLNQELKRKNNLKTFSLIITCRENYIYNLQNVECDYITLQAWNEEQIESFCKTYWKKCRNKISEKKIQKIVENKEIFGIPLILYMILALDITIEKSSSIVDVYDQIFSLEKGGIYDRCYDIEHRINEPEIKKYIHRASQRIAFWIFENNDNRAFIYQKNFKEICEDVMSEAKDKDKDIQSDTLIGGYFKIRHCEGKLADEVNFVHRSIYEYFVALYLFESIIDLTSIEEIAGKLGELLKDGYLSEQILKFMKSKFDYMRRNDLSDITKEAFQVMLRDGMTYHTEKLYSNVIEREMNIFSNMLKFVQLWNPILGKLGNRVVAYLKYNQRKLSLNGIVLENINLSMIYLIEANLSKANLNGANLDGVYLNGADLSGAYLFGTNLRSANLSKANLKGTYLNGADLREANLSGADLSNAYLKGTYLRGANLNSADLRGINLLEANLLEADLENTIFDEKQVDLLSGKYDLSSSKVYVTETDEVINYQEYRLGE